MLESLYGDIFSQYVGAVAAARKKTEEEMRRLIDQGFYIGERALQAGLVDDLMYEDELGAVLQDRGKKLSRILYEDYLRVKPSSLGLETGKKIALIFGTGLIHGGESQRGTMGSATLSRWLKRARQDRTIAAVVFRVDSPGGSAVASDVIWREVLLTKKEKPTIVSMSDLAGSGGYWVAMAANRIVAQPQTLTGSIGVISGKFNLSGLYEKLGISAEKIVLGRRADFFSSFRGFTPEEKDLMKKDILWIYDQFLTKTAEGRDMTKEEIDKVGKGRVWTGNQAQKLGLVDELGGMSKAIGLAKKLAGIPADQEVRLEVWPKSVSFLASLLGRVNSVLPSSSDRDLDRLVSFIRTAATERVWAFMPFWIRAD
jgi:protease-4